MEATTVFPRSLAAATICFILQVTAATIRGQQLLEGGINNVDNSHFASFSRHHSYHLHHASSLCHYF